MEKMRACTIDAIPSWVQRNGGVEEIRLLADSSWITSTSTCDSLVCLKLHTRAWKCTKHSPQRLATDVWSSTPHFRVIFQKFQRIYNASLFWLITVFLSNDELTADSRSKLLPTRWLSSFLILCWSTIIAWLVHLPIVKDDFTAILQNLHALHTFHFL